MSQKTENEQFCIAANQGRIFKWNKETNEITTVVQVTFNLTAKQNPTCNIYVKDEIIDALKDSKTDFWRPYWFSLLDMGKQQQRDHRLSHFESKEENDTHIRCT